MSAATDPVLHEALRPLTADPRGAAIFCDIDGTLAPIVSRAEDARVGEEASLLLGRLVRSYGAVACVSGRSAAQARRLVGLASIAYVGSHGAELLEPGADRPELVEAFASWEGRVRDFAGDQADRAGTERLGVRLEDKGPIRAFHWRGAADEQAAQRLLEGVARQARTAGLDIHWGRKVLEIRPPVPMDKGRGVRTLLERRPASCALYGGDDATDLDAFDALDALVESRALDAAVRVGVRSPEGPAAIAERADLLVDGVDGFVEVLTALDHALR